MADETTPTDKPLAHLAETEASLEPAVRTQEAGDPRPSDRPTNEPEPGDTPATDRLRAFEEKHFGKEAVRINGRIERGSGSPYQMAHPSVREQHMRLERLIETEQKLVEAHAVLMAADEAHDAAEKAVADAEKDADGIPAE